MYSIRKLSSAVQSRSAPISLVRMSRASLSDQTPRLAMRHIGDGLLLALRRIGGQKIVERGRICVALLDDDQFRHAARKHVAAEPVAVDQPSRCVAHGFQPLQPELQHRRQFLAAFAVVAGLLGDQQLRLEEGQPRRHDQIVGGELEPAAARAVSTKARYCSTSARIEMRARSTFWLRARCSKQVERAFEAGDVDDQRWIAGDARHRRSRPTDGPSVRPSRPCSPMSPPLPVLPCLCQATASK